MLAIAAGATLCGACGYKAMAEWAADLSPRARERFRCRHRGGRYEVPSEYVIRDVLVRVDPDQLDRALRRFDAARGNADDAIAIDGKTMRNAIYTDARAPQAEARAANGDAKPATGKIGENQCQVHILGARPARRRHPHPKKVDRLPLGADDQTKRTNEIGTVVPMLEGLELDFAGKTFTADALLTQRKLADFLHDRGAHFVFTAKGNQPTLLDDLRLFFARRGEPDFREPFALQHGRLESRAIWTTARLNGHLTFPHVGQAFLVERTVVVKKSRKHSVEYALGITSHGPDTADARRLLQLNRGHWKVESVHNILDNAFDEDRLRIRTGHGPENTTRLRRFAIGVIRSHTDDCVAAAMRRLNRNPRRVFDYLRMTRNTLRISSTNRRTN